MYGVKGSFLFTPLRPHPRFQALLAKMNLGDRDVTLSEAKGRSVAAGLVCPLRDWGLI